MNLAAFGAAGLAALQSQIATVKTSIAAETTARLVVASALAAEAVKVAKNIVDIAANAADIATNTADIATNTADVATNTADIATNTADVATNVTAIGLNTDFRDGVLEGVAVVPNGATTVNVSVPTTYNGQSATVAFAEAPTAAGTTRVSSEVVAAGVLRIDTNADNTADLKVAWRLLLP